MGPGRQRTEAGVDGCRGGWVVATDGWATEGLTVEARFADVLLLVEGIVAVDMPIGLPALGQRRACDTAARGALGRRRSSVFPAPSREALAAGSFAEVAGLSIQAWNLVPKVREVDEAWLPRVREVSPELSFAVLAGQPMAHPKRTAGGRSERLEALGLTEVPRVRGAAADDVLDALACLRSAHRLAAGTALALGDGTLDARGRPMTIHA
jgi:predicted RNase H-like nuclease